MVSTAELKASKTDGDEDEIEDDAEGESGSEMDVAEAPMPELNREP